MTPRYLTVEDAAARVSLTAKALRRRIDRGVGPDVIKLGPGRRGDIRIDVQDLDLWMRRHRKEAS